MSEEDLVKGIGSMAGDSSAAGGSSPAGAPVDDVGEPSQAELVRQFGNEFRRSMQAAIGRKPIGWNIVGAVRGATPRRVVLRSLVQ